MPGRFTGASLSQEAYATVREWIVRGDLQLGQAISRRFLASKLGMSILPISEALLRLEVEGLLESRPRAGTRVRIPTPQDVEGHYIVREALEMQAARLFAEKASPEDKANLQKLAALLDILAPENESDRMRYQSLHEKLHVEIAKYTYCEALSEAVAQTQALASAWMSMGALSVPSSRHQTLVDALASGDAENAMEAMREHIHSSKQEALARLEPYFALKETRGARYSRNPEQPAAQPGAN